MSKKKNLKFKKDSKRLERNLELHIKRTKCFPLMSCRCRIGVDLARGKDHVVYQTVMV